MQLPATGLHDLYGAYQQHTYSTLLSSCQQCMLHWHEHLDCMLHQLTKNMYSGHALALCPGTSGVDAFAHKWAFHPTTGRKHLAYINGPFDKMGAIVKKIEDEKVNCVLNGPVWPRRWVAMWQSLPIRAVQARQIIACQGRMYHCARGCQNTPDIRCRHGTFCSDKVGQQTQV